MYHKQSHLSGKPKKIVCGCMICVNTADNKDGDIPLLLHIASNSHAYGYGYNYFRQDQF